MGKTDKQTSVTLLDKVISRVRFDNQQQVVAELCCSADFPAFAGHFPGKPVLPAVIQLAVVRSLTSDLLGRSLVPVRTGRLKFKGMVGPDDLILVRIDVKREGENWMSSFKLEQDGKRVSSGSLVFEERL